ncbi:MAG: hypothetical protein JSR72_06215 [Proteobacteria bacterium]|nr:hypothetical protein [Pseudomonadota bacterium]
MAQIPASISANENSALRRDASATSVAEDDYQSFCQALGASARGRAFLQEYARRNRHADTEVVLEALNRLEQTARTHKPANDADRIRQDLRALLDTLRTAKPQTENSPSAIKAATLSALIDFAQARLEALVTMPDDLRALEALAAVPAPEQPELPIPQPLAASPAPVVLVQAPPRVTEAPAAEKPAPAKGPAAAQAPEALGIPNVEFDYEAQFAARPAVSLLKEPAPIEAAAAWSELSPPPVAAPQAEVKTELKAEPAPELPPQPMAPVAASQPNATVDTRPEAKLDIKLEAALETETQANPASAPQSAPEPGRIFKAGEVETYELWLDDLTVEVTESIVAETIAPTPAPELPPPAMATSAVAPSSAAPTALAALVEQLQRPTPPGAAPATIGKIEVADPLAPILALSDDERLALFT